MTVFVTPTLCFCVDVLELEHSGTDLFFRQTELLKRFRLKKIKKLLKAYSPSNSTGLPEGFSCQPSSAYFEIIDCVGRQGSVRDSQQFI